MRSRLRQLRLLFCALRYGIRLIWLAAPEHHKLHWIVSLAARMREDEKLAAHLSSALPRLAPIASAFAQSVATHPELATSTLHDAIDTIEHFEEPLTPDQLNATFQHAFGKAPQDLFSWIDPTPCHNGWCEQTHVARLKLPANGHQMVTVRVLRAKQAQEVDDDAALLCAVARWLERFSSGARKLKLRTLAQTLRDDLQRRFDLRAQAANLSQSGHHLADDKRVLVPDVIWDFCTPQTLTVEHVDTLRATDIAGLTMHHINVTVVAAHLIEVVTQQAFEHGFFHAAFDARRVAVSIEPATRGRLVFASAALMTSLSSPEREFFVHGATALFEQDYGRLATLHHVAGHVPAHARPEQIEAELRTRAEAHFADDANDRSAGALFHHLLNAVQPFGGAVSPRLAAAQRAFGQAEALARTIHPDVDAWGIAKTTLGDIARRDLGPHGWINRLAQELPHLAQIGPRVPQLIYRFMHHHAGAQHGQRGAHGQAQAALLDEMRRENRRTRALLIACALSGTLIGVAATFF
ncbi:ABC transporter [Paraburkholderia sp. Ac-20340]|uniref:ABC1 kinase family protein n=1 Tax=Paraburkholderia sp. Ac-20340 TaxID=2703888 RepID=UPI00197CE24D|nr:AarF/UbiB family protein [Paraburkholderia sp. Ac-20340]MBN3858709.1 ABC transporter [Paraburkholderia sp. Ac-20340]